MRIDQVKGNINWRPVQTTSVGQVVCTEVALQGTFKKTTKINQIFLPFEAISGTHAEYDFFYGFNI